MTQESDVSSLEPDSLPIEQAQIEEGQGEAKSQDIAVNPEQPKTEQLLSPRQYNPLSQPH